jgi:hypothetical protein
VGFTVASWAWDMLKIAENDGYSRFAPPENLQGATAPRAPGVLWRPCPAVLGKPSVLITPCSKSGMENTGIHCPLPCLNLTHRDVPLTYELLGHLDHGRQQQRALKKKKYSCGIIAFNFAVRGTLSKLSHHNVFLSSKEVPWWWQDHHSLQCRTGC